MSKFDTGDIRGVIPDIGNLEMILQADVPGLPPSVNTYKRHSRGVTYVTREARAWKESTAWLLNHKWGHKRAPHEGKVYVLIATYMKNTELSDIDNRIKLMQDAAQDSGILKNDRQVDCVTAIKLSTTEGDEHTGIAIFKMPRKEVENSATR
jgi:Holliday junction resolvase RusA-like endonuclease